MNNEFTISIAEACSRLSIGRSKLYDMMDKGELASIKLGRRRLIRSADLEVLIDAAEVVS